MSDTTITQSLPSINSGYTTQTVVPKVAVQPTISQVQVEKSSIIPTDSNTSTVYKSANSEPVTTTLQIPTKPTSPTPSPKSQSLITELASLQSDLSAIQGIDDVLNKDPKDITQEDIAKIQTFVKSGFELLYSADGKKITPENNQKIGAMLQKLNTLCSNATNNILQQGTCDTAIKESFKKNDALLAELRLEINKPPKDPITQKALLTLLTMYDNAPDLASKAKAAKCIEDVMKELSHNPPDSNKVGVFIGNCIQEDSLDHVEKNSASQRSAATKSFISTSTTKPNTPVVDSSPTTSKNNVDTPVITSPTSAHGNTSNNALESLRAIASALKSGNVKLTTVSSPTIDRIMVGVTKNNIDIKANTTKKQALQNDMKKIMYDVEKTMDNPTMKSLKKAVEKISIGKMALFKKLIDEKTKELSLEKSEVNYGENLINESINKIQKNIDKLQDELDVSIDGSSADIVPLLQAFRSSLTNFGDQKQAIERRTQDAITVDQNNSRINEENERRQKKYSEAKDALGVLSQNAKINNNVSYRAKVALLENDIKSLGILLQETK